MQCILETGVQLISVHGRKKTVHIENIIAIIIDDRLKIRKQRIRFEKSSRRME